MKKILFIIPPYRTYESYVKPAFNESHYIKKDINGNEIYVTNILTDMPLGVLSLSAYLKRYVSDINIELLDFNVELNKMAVLDFPNYDHFFERILLKYNQNDFDYIGISALFISQFSSLITLGNVIKRIFNRAFLVAGGGIPTTMYKDIYQKTNDFDALCLGEGEIPWANLLNATKRDEYLLNASSWMVKRKIESQYTPQLECVENLDEIPFLDYDLCNLDDYAMSPTVKRIGGNAEEKQLPNFHYMSSRGCPNKCCFCASHAVHGRTMRYYSIERVKEDLTKLKTKYKTQNIVMQDDHFMADKKRAYKILEIMHDLELIPVFQNALAMYALDHDFLAKLVEYNIRSLVLPIESGSQRVLRDIMHKPLNLTIIERVVNDCRELGIHTDANILIGLPGETKQDIEDAISFLKKIPVSWYYIYIASPLAGSEMFDICKTHGYLGEGYYETDFKKACVSTEDFSAEYILQKSYEMNLELNFVNNSDYRLGNYEIALKRFLQVIELAENHFWANYMCALCYKKMGNIEKYSKYFDKSMKIAENDSQQKRYYDLFCAQLKEE